MLEMKMSDKFNCIYELNEVDNKEEIVKEIRALKTLRMMNLLPYSEVTVFCGYLRIIVS